MKIVKIGNPEIVMSNSESNHNYFGWSTATRLQNGKIAVAASGFRFRHICPFGKTVISYSSDNGKSYTSPAPVFDTVLDDRDGGIVAFGEKNVLVSSFNNTVEYQRTVADSYANAYLDTISKEEEEKVLGSGFKISEDCGVTFGETYKSPITSPHGPITLNDGSLFWIGVPINPHKNADIKHCIQAYKINEDYSMTFLGEIENVTHNGIKVDFWEPHAIQTDDGTIITHIRAHNYDDGIHTLYQSESADGGKTWTTPHCILPDAGGYPAHLFRHSSGMLISAFSLRQVPHSYGVKVMFSKDNGKTWDHGFADEKAPHESGYSLYLTDQNNDLGYPSTIELDDGSMLTFFYAHPEDTDYTNKNKKDGPCNIMQQRWRFEE